MNFILRNIVRFIKLFYFKFLKYEKEKLSHSFKKGEVLFFQQASKTISEMESERNSDDNAI